jgi:hypothetical protein
MLLCSNALFVVKKEKCNGQSHHAQTPAVLEHSRTLPQGDGSPRPALAGGEEGGERDLIVPDATCSTIFRRQGSRYRRGR